MKTTLNAAKRFLWRPTDAADSATEPQAISNALKIYLVWAILSVLYFAWKPTDFPDENAVHAVHGAAFWFRVVLWEPVIAVLTITITGLVLEWMREGWLPAKTAVATIWTAIPLGLTLGYVKFDLPKAAFAGGMLMWSVPAVLISRRIAAARWKTLTAFLLGLNVIGIALLVPEVVVCLLRSKPAFNGLLGVELIWMLTCGGLGLARLAKTSTARAVLAFLFANLAMNVALAAAFVLGWLPLEVLKVLMYF